MFRDKWDRRRSVVITTPSEDSNVCSEAVILTRVDSYCFIVPFE